MNPHFDFKIVVAGPFAAGKTTMIAASADGPLVGTEAPTSGGEAAVKATTTVGMEYGTLAVASDSFSVELNLYGVPGQERFSFMWDIVGVGMDGLFLLVDADRPETWATSATMAAHFGALSSTPVVVGVNRASTRPEVVEQVRHAVPVPGARYIGFEVIDPQDARNALLELLLHMLEQMNDEPAAQTSVQVATP